MNTVFDSCMKTLETGVAANEKETNSIKRLSLNLVLIEDILRHVGAHTGADEDCLPPFISKWVFFEKCHELEICRYYSTPAKFQSHCEEELSKVYAFFERNKNFCKNYYGEDEQLSRLLFLEEGPAEILELPIRFPFRELNNRCLKASYFLGYEQYGTLLKQELSFEQIPSNITKERSSQVNATETDMVELGLALHAAGVFPSCTQKAIIDRIRQFSGLSLEHWEQLGANIRNRKSGLEFLERLTSNLAARNEEIEESGRARRRPKSNW